MKKIFAYFFSPKGLDKREVPPVSQEEIENGGYAPWISYEEEPLPFEVSGGGTSYDLPPRRIKKSYPYRQPQTGEFRWRTDDDELLLPSDMATPHLFYAVRMLYNHSIPPFLRVGQFKRRVGVAEWPVDYRIQATNALGKELLKRSDLEPWMKDELGDMAGNVRAFVPQNFSPIEYTIMGGLTTDKIREALRAAGVNDPDRYIPTGGDTRKLAGKQDKIDERRAKAKAERMKRAVNTAEFGFPGKRCMEHRSYAGIRKPRVDCNACKQVYRARKQNRQAALNYDPSN